ncbi:hypothetical protein ACA910_012406 [Epithemia clementina (nom. ined.)]
MSSVADAAAVVADSGKAEKTKQAHDGSPSFPQPARNHRASPGNALSIPDPPRCRNDGADSQSNRSSANSARALREISNSSDTEDEIGSNNSSVTALRKSRHKRKTMMSHSLMSPVIETTDPEEIATEFTTPIAPAPTLSTLSTPHFSEKLPSLHLHKKEGSSKRRKKRQSIVLPSDVEATDRNCDEFTQKYASFKNDPSPPATPATETKTPNKPPIDVLHDLRKLVHSYTSIPKHERSSACISAKNILACTGYPLLGFDPTAKPCPVLGVASDLTREQKLEFFCKIGPQLKHMDACKVSDAKMVEEVTQCKSQKVRGGFYRYFHGETGREVTTEEFEERYLMMLDEVNRIRSTAWAEYFDALRDDKKVKSGASVDEVQEMKTGTCQDAGETSSSTETNPVTQERQLHVSTSPSRKVLPWNELHATPARHEDLSCVAVKSNVKKSHVMANEVTARSDAKLPPTIIPFPDRDEESSDPVIAQAERKLWDSIDKALEEYSREVMAAQRRTTRTANASTAAPQTPVHC